MPAASEGAAARAVPPGIEDFLISQGRQPINDERRTIAWIGCGECSNPHDGGGGYRGVALIVNDIVREVMNGDTLEKAIARNNGVDAGEANDLASAFQAAARQNGNIQWEVTQAARDSGVQELILTVPARDGGAPVWVRIPFSRFIPDRSGGGAAPRGYDPNLAHLRSLCDEAIRTVDHAVHNHKPDGTPNPHDHGPRGGGDVDFVGGGGPFRSGRPGGGPPLGRRSSQSGGDGGGSGALAPFAAPFGPGGGTPSRDTGSGDGRVVPLQSGEDYEARQRELEENPSRFQAMFLAIYTPVMAANAQLETNHKATDRTLARTRDTRRTRREVPPPKEAGASYKLEERLAARRSGGGSSHA